MKWKFSNTFVTNDHTETGVALVQAYSGRLKKKKEDQFNFMLQVVEEHRKTYPDAKKQTFGQQWVAGHHDTPAFEQVIPIILFGRTPAYELFQDI